MILFTGLLLMLIGALLKLTVIMFRLPNWIAGTLWATHLFLWFIGACCIVVSILWTAWEYAK